MLPGLCSIPIELLEQILHYLPLEQLSPAQLVCRKWHTLINESQQLQQDLFILPVEPGIGYERTMYWYEGIHLGDRYDPMKMDGWQGCTRTSQYWHTSPHPDHPRLTYSVLRRPVCRLNPLLFEVRKGNNDDLSSLRNLFSRDFSPLRPWLGTIPARYRSMLISQPPLWNVQYYFSVTQNGTLSGQIEGYDYDVGEGGTVSCTYSGVVEKSDGITFGDLLDAIDSTMEEAGGGMIKWDRDNFWIHNIHMAGIEDSDTVSFLASTDSEALHLDEGRLQMNIEFVTNDEFGELHGSPSTTADGYQLGIPKGIVP